MENLDKPKRQKRDWIDIGLGLAQAATLWKTFQIGKDVKNIRSEVQEIKGSISALEEETYRTGKTVDRLEERLIKQDERLEKKDREKELKNKIRKMAYAMKKALEKIEENNDLVYKYLSLIYCDEIMGMNNINIKHFTEFHDLEFIDGIDERIDELGRETRSKFRQIDIDDLNLVKDINKDNEEIEVSNVKDDVGIVKKKLKKLEKEKKKYEKQLYCTPATDFISTYGNDLSVVDEVDDANLYSIIEKYEDDKENKSKKDVFHYETINNVFGKQKNRNDYSFSLSTKINEIKSEQAKKKKPLLLTLLEIPWSLYFPQYEIFQEYKWKSLKMAFITILGFWIPFFVIATIMAMIQGDNPGVESMLRGWISLGFHGIAFLFIIFFILATIQWSYLIFIALMNLQLLTVNEGLSGFDQSDFIFWGTVNLIFLGIFVFFISVKYCISKLNKVWKAKTEELQLSQKNKDIYKTWIRERSGAENDICNAIINYEKNKEDNLSKTNSEINLILKENVILDEKINVLKKRINWEIDKANNLAHRRPFLSEFVKNRIESTK